MGLPTEYPRAASGFVVVNRDGVDALVIHDERRIPLAKGTRKSIAAVVYVPKAGMDCYVLADEDPTSRDPTAIVLKGDVDSSGVALGGAAPTGTVDEAAIRADQRAKDRAEAALRLLP